jgi:hypothetical protein
VHIDAKRHNKPRTPSPRRTMILALTDRDGATPRRREAAAQNIQPRMKNAVMTDIPMGQRMILLSMTGGRRTQKDLEAKNPSTRITMYTNTAKEHPRSLQSGAVRTGIGLNNLC